MDINFESIAAFQKIVMQPDKYELKFRPINECFEKSDTVTAKHILASDYIEYMESMGAPIAKLVVYIIMDKIYGLCDGKDQSGNLGYFLKFIPVPV